MGIPDRIKMKSTENPRKQVNESKLELKTSFQPAELFTGVNLAWKHLDSNSCQVGKQMKRETME